MFGNNSAPADDTTSRTGQTGNSTVAFGAASGILGRQMDGAARVGGPHMNQIPTNDPGIPDGVPLARAR